jgi:DNA-binding NarL/FixJ family response regulator
MGEASNAKAASDGALHTQKATAAVLAPRTSIRRRIADALTLDDVEVTLNTGALGELEVGRESGEPDVLILALDETCAARRAVSALRRILPGVRLVLVAPGTDAVRTPFAGIESQLDGVVYDTELTTALAPTVRAVLAGQVVFPRNGLRRNESPPPLSHRERQVLRLAATGRTNDQIAAKLFLSTSTVKGHLTSAFAKLDVRSRSEATALILNPEEPVSHLVFGRAYAHSPRRFEPQQQDLRRAQEVSGSA